MNDPIGRFLFFLLISGGFALLVCAWKRCLRQVLNRDNRSQVHARKSISGTRSVWFFRSDHCASCEVQERELTLAQAVLRSEGRDFLIRRIDAVKETALAEQMRIITVPTTVVLDAHGKVTLWSPGVIGHRRIVREMQFDSDIQALPRWPGQGG
ncbi:MAG: hypothetical protein IT282_03195 [Bacteroidetes bacterium]|nr:hypothetical protein [Bacteroidota bacterium]